MSLTHPELLWLLLALPVFWYAARYRSFEIGHPRLDIHRRVRTSSWLGLLSTASQSGLWFSLTICVAIPLTVRYLDVIKPGALVYVLQDTSDSQANGVTIPHELELIGLDPALVQAKRASGEGPGGSYHMDGARPGESQANPRRIDVSFAAIRLFLQHTYGNPVALLAFDDGVYKVYPPTVDYKTIVNSLDELDDYIKGEGRHGTNFDGPSGSKHDAGALQGACDAFRSTDPSVVKILIMSTDGGAAIAPDRAKQLVACFRKEAIHMIVFGVGEDWYGSSPSEEIKPLQEFVKAVGGIAVPVGDKQAFDRAVGAVDDLAKNSVYLDKRSDYSEDYILWLTAAGCFFVMRTLCVVATRE